MNQNIGFPVSINFGLAKCRGEIIATLNNDLIFPPNWFDGLINTLENNKEIGVAVPHLSYSSGPQNVGVRFNEPIEIFNFSKNFITLMNIIDKALCYSHHISSLVIK